MRLFLITVSILILITSCANDNDEAQNNCANINAETADDCLRLNQIQVLGTHNSYKLPPVEALVERLDTEQPGWADNILYEHRPLSQQLEELGIRQIELDIFADPEGGMYARPAGAVLVDDEQFIDRDEMLEPGYKVIHTQDVDYRTNCLTFESCLSEVRDWSLENPNHLPILILVEVKDSPQEDAGPISFITPLTVDESLIYEIDEEIWSVFSEEQVITPDEVRNDFDSLEEAILADGWPTLSQSRGRILFALDNTDETREAYLSESPDLNGRAMFVSSEPGEPTAAFIKMNDAIDSYEEIKERVAEGYLIRTRSDIPLHEGRTGDTRRLMAALTSGAQFISTDFPEQSTFGSDYIVKFPESVNPGRCNPLNAPTNCRDHFLTE